MKRLLTLIVCVILSLAGEYASAGSSGWEAHEQAFLALVNRARANPLEAAKGVGLDPQKLVIQFPELEEVFSKGLPPLNYNEKLRLSASGHTADMLAKGYYSKISRDGRTFKQRIVEAGYIASHAGEALGMISFNNYISIPNAVSSLFANLLRDELRPDRKEERLILSSAFDEIGIGLGTGVFVLGGTRVNAYVVTCDFGKDAVTEIEDNLLGIINNARLNPEKAITGAGLLLEEVFAKSPDLEKLFSKGLKPLMRSAAVRRAAEAWLDLSSDRGYFYEDATGNSPLVPLLLEQGYLPYDVGSAAVVLSPDTDTSVLAGELFDSLLRREINSGEDMRFLFNADLEHMECRVSVGTFSLTGGDKPGYFVACLFLAGRDGARLVERELIALVNRARNKPKEMLERLGFDPDEIEKGLPGSSTLLDEGVGWLWNNRNLYDSAKTHSSEMSARKYISETSPDGAGPENRIEKAGYEASLSGGLVGSSRFAPTDAPAIALELLKKLLVRDLVEYKGGLLLKPEFKDIGIGVAGALFGEGVEAEPLVLVTVDLGARASGVSPGDEAEMLFLELVNEARMRPFDMAASLGVPPETIQAAIRSGGAMTNLGSDPLFLNDRLWRAARGHIEDMIERYYFSSFSLPYGLDGWSADTVLVPGSSMRPGLPLVGPRERILREGYVPTASGELLDFAELDIELYPEDAVWLLFAERFVQEINPAWKGERLILGADYKELGIGLGLGTVVMSGAERSGYILTVDFASSGRGVDPSNFRVSY